MKRSLAWMVGLSAVFIGGVSLADGFCIVKGGNNIQRVVFIMRVEPIAVVDDIGTLGDDPVDRIRLFVEADAVLPAGENIGVQDFGVVGNTHHARVVVGGGGGAGDMGGMIDHRDIVASRQACRRIEAAQHPAREFAVARIHSAVDHAQRDAVPRK